MHSVKTLITLLALPLFVAAAPSHTILDATPTPKGTNETINGILTYVTLPEGQFDNDTAALLLTGTPSSL
jgi:hypothetical protein